MSKDREREGRPIKVQKQKKTRLMKHFKSKHEKSTLEVGENQIENSQDDDLDCSADGGSVGLSYGIE